MVILVTGGAGFVGSAIVDRLVAAGHDVRVLDALHPDAHRGAPDYLNPRATYLFGDLADPDTADRAVRGVDAVSHQASLVGLGVAFSDVTDYARHNVLATAQLLRSLHDAGFRGRIALAGSMAVYGEGAYCCPAHGSVRALDRRPEDLGRQMYEPRCPRCEADLVPQRIAEDSMPRPRSVYAATKLHQEHLVEAFGREHRDASVVTLRYHNVYGPRMPENSPYSGVAAILRSAYESGVAPTIYEDGRQLRDFVHVDDVTAANVLALTAPDEVDGTFNVASGEAHTVLELAQVLAAAIPGTPPPMVSHSWRAADIRHVLASTDRATEKLGFAATVPFGAGVADFATSPLRGNGAREPGHNL
jgi:dTDP-L-rhamnose 4-epimerase